jgi:hypothetical protein
MGRPPTEGSALQETAPDLEFIAARGAGERRVNTSPAVENQWIFMNIEPTARVRLAEDVLMQKVGDDAILLNLNTENYFTLDEVGTRIINTLQESDSVKQAIGKLVGIYEVDESKLTSDAIHLVEECQQHGLLQITAA